MSPRSILLESNQRWVRGMIPNGRDDNPTPLPLYRSTALPPYCTPKPPYHPRYDHAPPFSGLHSQQVSLGPSRTPYHDQDYGSRPDGNIGTVSITTRIFPFPDAVPVTLTNPFPAFMSDHPPTTPPVSTRSWNTLFFPFWPSHSRDSCRSLFVGPRRQKAKTQPAEPQVWTRSIRTERMHFPCPVNA